MPKKQNKRRKDGRIAVQIFLGKNEDGKRNYKTVYGQTQKEANDKAMEFRLLRKKGINVLARQELFRVWAERWIKLKSIDISKSQAKVYRSCIKHLSQEIGDMPLYKISSLDIQFVVNKLALHNPNTQKPASKKMLKTIHATASQIFRLAIDNRVLEYNPCDSVKIPSNAPETKRCALTEQEQSWIIDTPHRTQCAAMIMMLAGLRRGELLALNWEDIDLKNKTITVNKAVATGSNGNTFEIKHTTKKDAGMRTVNIPQLLVDFLEKQHKRNIYVCVNTKNEMHTQTSWRRLWESYLIDLNLKYGEFDSKFDPKGVPFVIEHVTPHMLRHTFATMLYMAGRRYTNM